MPVGLHHNHDDDDDDNDDDDDDDDDDHDHDSAFEHSLNQDACVATSAMNNKNNCGFQSGEMTTEVQATCELFESIVPS